jgi:hypothetical protein
MANYQAAAAVLREMGWERVDRSNSDPSFEYEKWVRGDARINVCVWASSSRNIRVAAMGNNIGMAPPPVWVSDIPEMLIAIGERAAALTNAGAQCV